MSPAVIAVLGTRPEVIKVAPVVAALDRIGASTQSVLFTGQQAELGQRAFDDCGLAVTAGHHFGARPRRLLADLRVMTAWAHGQLGRLAANGGAWVLVQGDTLSALAGTLAARRAGLPVVHLEAGLRSHDTTNPFPEEYIRRLIATHATLHLAPSAQAVRNLLGEGVDPAQIVVVGNPGLDGVGERGVEVPQVLVTLHRRESLGTPMRHLLDAVLALSIEHPEVQFVVLEHSNPRVAALFDAVLMSSPPNIVRSPPLSHDAFLQTLATSRLVITDSGGVQEEAAALGVRTLVARDRLDRFDGVDSGATVQVGTDTTRVVSVAREALASSARYAPRVMAGSAAETAAAALLTHLSSRAPAAMHV